MERICTDVALLDHGTAEIQGKLADIRSRRRSDQYTVETENKAGMLALQEAFPLMRHTGPNQLVFLEENNRVFDIMRFAADRQIPLLRIEREEATLESLFMEVVEK